MTITSFMPAEIRPEDTGETLVRSINLLKNPPFFDVATSSGREVRNLLWWDGLQPVTKVVQV